MQFGMTTNRQRWPTFTRFSSLPDFPPLVPGGTGVEPPPAATIVALPQTEEKQLTEALAATGVAQIKTPDGQAVTVTRAAAPKPIKIMVPPAMVAAVDEGIKRAGSVTAVVRTASGRTGVVRLRRGKPGPRGRPAPQKQQQRGWLWRWLFGG